MPASLSIGFASQQLQLRADRSLWWPQSKVLFVADVHAGKTAHLARAGLRVPAGSLQADLDRLAASVQELGVERLIILGDLFHSDVNSEWQRLTAWRRTLPCSFELVRGNHDRFMSDELLRAGGVIVHEEGYRLEPFELRHHPREASNTDYADGSNLLPVLCGHVHPVFTARGAGRDRLRLTCFVVQEGQIILPAYGSFTGGYDTTKLPYRQLVGCSPDFQEVLVRGRGADAGFEDK